MSLLEVITGQEVVEANLGSVLHSIFRKGANGSPDKLRHGSLWSFPELDHKITRGDVWSCGTGAYAGGGLSSGARSLYSVPSKGEN